MKLSKWAKNKGITYGTALKWFHQGRIDGSYQMETGTILVNEAISNPLKKRVCVYARVSSNSRRKEMEYQIDRICQFAMANGYSVDKIYKEVASGMNDNRNQLWKMIETNPSHIIIENKDRLTRFGFNYLERLLGKVGCKIIVANKDQEDETDLMKDLISIITSFCCRLYGLRRGQNKANKIKEELSND